MRFVAKILILISISISTCYAQQDLSSRDNLTLAPGTQISMDDRGRPFFTFPNIVNEKWPENTQIGKLKRRALIEVLIYRKFSVEFLLKARERMKYLLAALGHDQDPELFSPYRLRVALNSAFSVAHFRELHENYISRSLDPTIQEKIVLDSVSLRGYMQHLVEESLTIVRRQTELARVEQETKEDLLQAGWNGVNWERMEENWRDLCEIPRENLNSNPLIQSSQTNAVLKLRATQNWEIKQLLENLQAQSSDRVLFTPFNYKKNFTELGGEISILRDVNRIRNNPSSKQLLDFHHDQGLVASAIVAFVLQDLKDQNLFTWRKSTKEFPRSELLCTNWNEINAKIPYLSEEFWRKISDAYSQGLIESMKINEKALLYLISLTKKGFGEVVTGERAWKGDETLPENLEEVLDKFVDLVPTFQNSPEIMTWVRQVYPMGDEDPKYVMQALHHAQKEKEKRLVSIDHMMKAFTIASFVSMGSSILVEWKLSHSFVTAFLGLTTAVTIIKNMWPSFVYRQDMKNLVEALFFQIEPKTKNETIFLMDPVELEKVTLLDRQSALELYTMGATLLASGVWTSWRTVPSIFNRLVRAKRWATNGYVALDTKELLQVQEDLTKIMALVKRQFPASWKILSDLEYTNQFYRSISGYMPEAHWEKMFPDVYKKLRALGFRASMDEAEKILVIHSVNRSLGKQIPTRAQLWEIAETMGFVEQKLLSSKHMRAILDIDKPYQARASMDFLKRNVENKLSRLHTDINEQIRSYRKNVDSVPSHQFRSIKKDKAHIEQMETLSAELKKALGKEPFDDFDSKEVKGTLAKLKNIEEGIDRNMNLKNLIQGVQKAILYPFQVVSKVVPVGALTLNVRRVLAERLEAIGLGKLWREEILLKDKDEAFRIFANRFNLTVDKKTVTTYFHQGLVTGVPAQFLGDRTLRHFSKKDGVSFWHGDWDKTVVNITTGQLEAFLKTAIFTGAFTKEQRIAMSMGVSFAANAILTFPTNAGYTLFQNHFNFPDMVQTYTNPDCILAMSNRIATAGIFHSAYSTLRGRGTYVLRNILKSPQYGGIKLPDGRMGMKGITRGQIVVISFFDKAILGSLAWAALTNATQGGGTCKPFKDPYAQDFALSQWTPQEDENFKREIEERTGFKMNWTAEEIKALEEHYKNEGRGEGASPIQTVPSPPQKRETEFQRLQRELGVLQKRG